MDCFLDSELIIREVEKYPFLYDCRQEGFKSKELRRETWMEVTKNVVGEKKWEQMSAQTRHNVVLDLTRKWKNVKDRFYKSIKNGGEKGNVKGKSKRPYIYHKQLKFLLAVKDILENGNEDNSVTNDDGSDGPIAQADGPVIVAEQSSKTSKKRKSDLSERDDMKIASEAPIAKANEPTSVAGSSILFSHLTSNMPKKRKSDNELKIRSEATIERAEGPPTVAGPSLRVPIKEKSYPLKRDVLKIHQNVRQDSDEMFLLSQLPYIKKMKTCDKLQFQIQFLQLIQKYSNNSESTVEPTPFHENRALSFSSIASETPELEDNVSLLSF